MDDDDKSSLLVEARPGVGKSMLANHLALAQTFENGVIIRVKMSDVASYFAGKPATERSRISPRELMYISFGGEDTGHKPLIDRIFYRMTFGSEKIVWIFDGIEDLMGQKHPCLVWLTKTIGDFVRSGTKASPLLDNHSMVIVFSREGRGNLMSGAQLMATINPWEPNEAVEFVERYFSQPEVRGMLSHKLMKDEGEIDKAVTSLTTDLIMDILSKSFEPLCTLPIALECLCHWRSEQPKCRRKISDVHNRTVAAILGNARERVIGWDSQSTNEALIKMCMARSISTGGDGVTFELDSSIRIENNLLHSGLVRVIGSYFHGPVAVRFIQKPVLDHFRALYFSNHLNMLPVVMFDCPLLSIQKQPSDRLKFVVYASIDDVVRVRNTSSVELHLELKLTCTRNRSDIDILWFPTRESTHPASSDTSTERSFLANCKAKQRWISKVQGSLESRPNASNQRGSQEQQSSSGNSKTTTTSFFPHIPEREEYILVLRPTSGQAIVPVTCEWVIAPPKRSRSRSPPKRSRSPQSPTVSPPPIVLTQQQPLCDIPNGRQQGSVLLLLAEYVRPADRPTLYQFLESRLQYHHPRTASHMDASQRKGCSNGQQGECLTNVIACACALIPEADQPAVLGKTFRDLTEGTSFLGRVQEAVGVRSKAIYEWALGPCAAYGGVDLWKFLEGEISHSRRKEIFAPKSDLLKSALISALGRRSKLSTTLIDMGARVDLTRACESGVNYVIRTELKEAPIEELDQAIRGCLSDSLKHMQFDTAKEIFQIISDRFDHDPSIKLPKTLELVCNAFLNQIATNSSTNTSRGRSFQSQPSLKFGVPIKAMPWVQDHVRKITSVTFRERLEQYALETFPVNDVDFALKWHLITPAGILACPSRLFLDFPSNSKKLCEISQTSNRDSTTGKGSINKSSIDIIEAHIDSRRFSTLQLSAFLPQCTFANSKLLSLEGFVSGSLREVLKDQKDPIKHQKDPIKDQKDPIDDQKDPKPTLQSLSLTACAPVDFLLPSSLKCLTLTRTDLKNFASTQPTSVTATHPEEINLCELDGVQRLFDGAQHAELDEVHRWSRHPVPVPTKPGAPVSRLVWLESLVIDEMSHKALTKLCYDLKCLLRHLSFSNQLRLPRKLFGASSKAVHYLHTLVIEADSISDKDLAFLKKVKRSPYVDGRFPLRTVVIGRCSGLTKTGFKQLCYHVDVETLHLEGLSGFSSAMTTELLSLKSLTSLRLGGCLNINDHDIAQFGEKLTKLTHLSLDCCSGVTDAALSGLMTTRLTSLSLRGCWYITNRALLKMTESAATERLTQPLTKLQFGDSTFVNNDGLACLSKVALTDLSITACPNVSNGALSHIAEIAHLITLDLTGCGIDESGLAKVLSMTSLRALTLSCPLLTNDGLEPLSKLLALEELTFTSCYFNIDMEKFSKLTNLTSLTLSGTRNLASADLHHLTGLKLSKLNLEGCDVDDTGLSHLKTIITLTSLNLSCPHATKKGLQSINALKSLCELSLEYVDDIELKDLSTLRRLVSLSLKNSKRITGAGLREFSDHLTFLNVSGGQSFVELSDLASLALRRLDLNGCVSIQDEHLSYLSNMKFLRHLDLGNCTQITDAGLKNLTTSLQVGDIFTVPSLTSLNLSGCSKLGTTDIKRLRMIRNLAQLGVEVGIAELGDLPRLSSLRLACIVSKDDNFAKVTPIASLASLCLRGVDKTPILFRTNEMWAHVMTSLTIENIAFDGGVRENHGGLNELRALTCLRLINCQDIPLITELLNLKVLDVERSTTVDDDMLANFARNASLTSLNVSDCTLVTDTGLGHLVALPLLSRLNLNRCDKITSVGLRKLSTRFLRWIGLEACQKITWDAVRELRKDWCEVKLLPGADLTPRFDPPQEPLPAEEDNNDE